MLEILRNLPEESEVDLRASDNGRVALRSGNAKFTLAALPADNFPFLSLEATYPMGTCGTEAFRGALTMVEHAVPRADMRIFLNGVYFEASGDALRLVATDGHRLAATEMTFTPDGYPSEFTGILPRKSVEELIRLLAEHDGSVRISGSDRALVLETGEARFATRLIDARYPEYRRVIPENPPYHLEVDADSLAVALRQAECWRMIRTMWCAWESPPMI